MSEERTREHFWTELEDIDLDLSKRDLEWTDIPAELLNRWQASLTEIDPGAALLPQMLKSRKTSSNGLISKYIGQAFDEILSPYNEGMNYHLINPAEDENGSYTPILFSRSKSLDEAKCKERVAILIDVANGQLASRGLILILPPYNPST